MFVDLGDLGPDPVDQEEDTENIKSEVQTTVLEMEASASDGGEIALSRWSNRMVLVQGDNG